MKNILLASAAIVAYALPISAHAADLPLKAAPAVSMPQATGYIEVYGGWASTRDRGSEYFDGGSDFDQFSSSYKGSVLGGAGRGNYWLTPTYSMQLDVQAEGTSYDRGSSFSNGTSSVLDYLIAGHVNWRDSNRGLLGAFAGIGDVNVTRHALVGVEGQYYMNQWTFYLQGGYDTTLHSVNGSFAIDENDAIDMDAWFIRGTARYYLTPNLRLEATGMYAGGGINPSSLSCSNCFLNASFDSLLWEAKAEWKMDSSPFALFFKYRGSQTNYKTNGQDCSSSECGFGLDSKVTDNRFLVGARMYLGEKSLLWNDRQGATLDVISPLAIQSGPLYGTVASSGLSASDIRLKREIKVLTTLDNGLKIYSFKYRWSDTDYVGVMAQDLLANPAWRDAVVTSANGYYAVDYTKLGLKMTTLEDWEARGLAAIDIRRRVTAVRPSEMQQPAL